MRRMGPIIAVVDIKYAFQDMIRCAEYYQIQHKIPSEISIIKYYVPSGD